MMVFHDPDQMFSVALTSDEIDMLAKGLHVWAVPLKQRIRLRAMGFGDAAELISYGHVLPSP